MEARRLRAAILAASMLSLGASHRTENFIVTAKSAALSREVAEAAEAYRTELAEEWLGHPLPSWADPCPITVNVGRNLGAGGATSFMFERGRPFGWTMTIQGSRERIVDSVLPHEVTHTVFATHFGRPLPRWADEGACTTVEHDSEKNKQKKMLVQFLTTGRGIAFNHLFAMTEYPPDVMPLYAQGYSLARFLIAQGGKQEFVKYVGAGMDTDDWTQATRSHYGFKNLSELQVRWLDWVRTGSLPLRPQPSLVATSVPEEEEGPSLAATKASPVVVRPVSTSGWYARTRDTARTRRRSDVQPQAQQTAAAPLVATGQSVTRPQSPGRPRQTVLELTNPPRRQRPMQGRLIDRDALNRTVWR